ncbi:MAG: TIGR03960 family B12-binding radical SAM protein, partial [Nitrospinae bacterium]|nr:TIGR03960 family B12-binding radical SAM protein [Nitrospinota bacterium]
MSSDPRFNRLLETVRNPASYLGTEPNSVHKAPETVAAKIALAFPDLYELGMSHLGLKILYKIVNDHPDLAAERVFCPDDDFAEKLTELGLPLASLESRTPLSSFDIVGFTLPYELSTTTVLRMLDLARIPLLAADRGDADPLVVGGGAGVFNPEPMADFFDFFVLGDGERIVPQLLRLAAETRGVDRAERLARFAAVEGVYVPSLFVVTYRPDGAVAAIRPLKEGYAAAKRIWLPTLAESPYPVDMIVPVVETTQGRVNVEIDRGCTQGCRFCQAGTTYRPVRERTPDQVMAIMEEAVARTGYEELSVMSLSAGDYSQIGPLLTRLMDRYADDRVSLSLPSLRSATVTETIVEQVGRVKKTGFTLTAEAGSQRLRHVLNKKVDDDDIFRAAQLLLANGWRGIKLYFMIGLPTETDDDVDAIFELARELASLSVEGKRFDTINISVGNFVPKAHTAFQWAGQDPPDELRRKKERLFSLIRTHKRIRLKYHEPQMSQMEAAFSRGDRRLGRVTLSAYRSGCWLDGWSERYRHDRWIAAFETCGLDPAFYASRAIGLDETLPWEHIDVGLTKGYFR